MAYCTHGDVSAFLQVDAFADGGSATTPTQAQVETFIEMAESRIEGLTDHAWATANALSVTDERVRIQRVQSNVVSTRGRIQLRHYPILAFTEPHASPSLSQTNGNVKIWGSGGYVDYLDSANNKDVGSNVVDVSNDMWADIERGIIYLNSYSLHNMLNSSPAGVDGYVSYKYATATCPKDIKLACIYFTSAIIVSNDDLNLMAEGDDAMDNRSKGELFEAQAMKILKDNRRMERSMAMARDIGGFATGMVTP